MERGECEVTVDGKSSVLRGGDVFLTFPNQMHSYNTIEREEYSIAIISPDMIPEFQKLMVASRPVDNIIRGAAERDDIKALVRGMSDTFYSDEPYKESILRGYVTAFFGKILPMLELVSIKTPELNVLDTIMNYCVNNADKPLSLALLERELHVSRYYISHVMHDKLGVGFNDYVNSLRVSEACRFLRTTDMSITEISDASGFGTLRTFNRAFIKQMGVSPSDYKHSRKDDASVASIPQHHR
jgi:AraC-like DNA-binding protein